MHFQLQLKTTGSDTRHTKPKICKNSSVNIRPLQAQTHNWYYGQTSPQQALFTQFPIKNTVTSQATFSIIRNTFIITTGTKTMIKFFYSKYSDRLTIFQACYKYCHSQQNNQYLKSIQTLRTCILKQRQERAWY